MCSIIPHARQIKAGSAVDSSGYVGNISLVNKLKSTLPATNIHGGVPEGQAPPEHLPSQDTPTWSLVSSVQLETGGATFLPPWHRWRTAAARPTRQAACDPLPNNMTSGARRRDTVTSQKVSCSDLRKQVKQV
ncbi:hypothetical protein E2C01_099589 [Portunus trituberculatus]|uniref:Uncharacterized protein n=1 Tax=Portunus trituberculatus TaxID=210409 RepID=A0A5B7KA19_PORTR|nr:hypothetical protein [Portunus trituberculatus]